MFAVLTTLTFMEVEDLVFELLYSITFSGCLYYVVLTELFLNQFYCNIWTVLAYSDQTFSFLYAAACFLFALSFLWVFEYCLSIICKIIRLPGLVLIFIFIKLFMEGTAGWLNKSFGLFFYPIFLQIFCFGFSMP